MPEEEIADVSKMRVAELRAALTSFGLPVDGLKSDLQERLRAHYDLKESVAAKAVELQEATQKKEDAGAADEEEEEKKVKKEKKKKKKEKKEKKERSLSASRSRSRS